MKKIVVLIPLLICLFLITDIAVFADCGPKSSVTVYISGVENGREYYATLVSKSRSTGPERAYTQGDAEYIAKQDPVWRAFYNFSQTDEYYYLQVNYKLTDKDMFLWSYYPPDEFKILLYFPDDGSFIVSEPLERYAFGSKFTANVKGGSMTVEKGGGTKGVLVDFVGILACMAVTVMLELCVAKAFGYRGKVETRLIIILNIVTQIILHTAIIIAEQAFGLLGGIIAYIVLEFLILLIEGVIYSVVFHMYSEKKRVGSAIGYTFAANSASFFVGGLVLLVISAVSDILMQF